MKTREQQVDCMDCNFIREGCDKNCPFESSVKEIRDCLECDFCSEGCEETCPFELPERVAGKETSRLLTRKHMKAERSNAVALAQKQVSSAKKMKGEKDAKYGNPKKTSRKQADYNLAKAEERRQKRIDKNTK